MGLKNEFCCFCFLKLIGKVSMSTVLGGFSSLGCLLDPGLLCMMLQGRCSYSSGIIHDVIISAILHWTGQLKEVSHGYLDRLWAVPPLSVKSIVQFEQGTMDWVQEFKFCVALIVQKYCWLWAGNLSTRSHACQCLSAFQINHGWWPAICWLKPEQTEALEALITGKKVLTILLTGFGKNPIC